MAVEGVVASLKAGRNCTALGSVTMKLFAQRKVMSRIMEESKRSEDKQIEEDITDPYNFLVKFQLLFHNLYFYFFYGFFFICTSQF